jgi:D-3-phosphoglycerate dehydrogenase / 2-oxoglutarate reductase
MSPRKKGRRTLSSQRSKYPGSNIDTLKLFFGNVTEETPIILRMSGLCAGTLFGDQYLRLVQLGPYHLDAFMDGIMVIFTHRDVPGLIGFIGTIFGKHQVNIAQMTVGRQLPGGEAIAVLNLDNPPPEEALQEVRAHPQISSLSVVRLPKAGEMPRWFG